MTIDEAIKLLIELNRGGRCEISPTLPDHYDALEIGIEAMKAWKEYRGSGSLMDKMLLPGETEE